ncbi:MAG: Type II secretion system protein E [candidate division BRC1 bacterium ADurb.BinA364]|nr:MAG: Type II secretion system protein E [candidate division BRC1 bacterium ADurb.BinA364]
MGVEPRRYSAALELVIAQRLIRLLCEACKKPGKPAPSELDTLKIVPADDMRFHRAVGCDTCGGTGFYGRTGIFEILYPDENMKQFFETHATPTVIREMARKTGMRTLREEGVLKILKGQTTAEEVIRVTM